MALMMGDVRVTLPVVSIELKDNRVKPLTALASSTTSLVVAVHYLFEISSVLTRSGI